MAENMINNPLAEYGQFPMPEYLSPYQETLKKLLEEKKAAEEKMNAPAKGFDKYLPAAQEGLGAIAFLADITSGNRGRRSRARGQYDELKESVKKFVAEKDAKKRQKYADKIAALDSEGKYKEAIAEAQGIGYQSKVEEYKSRVNAGELRKSREAAKEPSLKDRFTKRATDAADKFRSEHPELEGDELWKAFKNADPVNYGHLAASGVAPLEFDNPGTGAMEVYNKGVEIFHRYVDPDGMYSEEEKDLWLDKYLQKMKKYVSGGGQSQGGPNIRNAPQGMGFPGMGQGANILPGSMGEYNIKNMPKGMDFLKSMLDPGLIEALMKGVNMEQVRHKPEIPASTLKY